MKMEFQRFGDGHQEALVRLHRSALVGISHGYPQEEEESDIRRIGAEYLSSGGEFLVGFVENQLAAMGGFRIVGEGVAELRRMRIAPELQGRGIGSALLERLETLAHEKMIRRLILETAASRPKTLAFYRGHGYVQVKEGRYGTQVTVAFEKDLAELPKQMADSTPSTGTSTTEQTRVPVSGANRR
jgi:GNAT superfamily N-acetyltransferase